MSGSVAEVRYDRQIRLWGRQGQQALQEAHIVALGATAAVSEALKSIVLTGVKAVTVVDERTVTPDDLACNFFLSMEDAGAPLAERVATHLGELNDDCSMFAMSNCSPDQWSERLVACATHTAGRQQQRQEESAGAKQSDEKRVDAEASVARDLAALMAAAIPVARAGTAPTAAAAAATVPITPLPTALLVSNRCRDLSSGAPIVRVAVQVLNIPVVLVESRGLTGFLQTCARDRLIVLPHPPSDRRAVDLRIFEPFPELAAWFAAHDPADTNLFRSDDPGSLNAHSHLPYIAILHHAYMRYVKRREETGQGPPTWPMTSKDYASIKDEVRSLRRREHPPQEGFQEALQNCSSALNRSLIPAHSVQALFADPRCSNPALAAAETCIHDGKLGEAGPVQLRVPPPVDGAHVLGWYLVHAVRAFYEASTGTSDPQSSEQPQDGKETISRHRVLPFCGHVPDMATTTCWFQELRTIYQRKHEADVAAVVTAFRRKLDEDLAAASVDATHATHITAVGVDKRMTAVEDVAHSQVKRQRLDGQHVHDLLGQRLISWASTLDEEDVQQTAKDLVANIWFACAVRFSPGFSTVVSPVDIARKATAEVEALKAATDEEKTCSKETSTETRTPCAQGKSWSAVLQDRLHAALQRYVNMGDDEAGPKRACGVGIALLASHEQARLGGKVETNIAGTCESGRLFPFLMELLSDTSESANTPSVHTASESDRDLLKKLCWEVERVGNTEVSSVAAILGALASQEVIKLVQHRHVPIGYPMVYSGVDGIYFALPA